MSSQTQKVGSEQKNTAQPGLGIKCGLSRNDPAAFYGLSITKP